MPIIELELDSSGAIKGLNEYDKAVGGSAQTTDSAFSKMRSSVNSIGTAVATGVVAGLATATTAFVAFSSAMSDAGSKAKEIENLSRLAGQSVEDFQNAAYATEKYGINAEKLADISKDVQDKLGDFIATGAGEFADFFENVAPKVGLTAEALAKLSGPDALIAVKKAMDDANVSAAEQVFYLESLGNDLSTLEPLLANNGELFRKNAEHAEKLGTALTGIQVENLRKGLEAVQQVTSMVVALKDKVLANLAPAFKAFSDLVVQYMADTGQSIDSVANSISGKLLDSLSTTVEVMQFVHTAINGIRLALQGALVIFGEVAKAGVSAFNFIGEAMVQAGFKDENPFESLMEDANLFAEAMKENFSTQYDGLIKTNNEYEKLKTKMKEAIKSAKEMTTEVPKLVAEKKKVLIVQEEIKKNIDEQKLSTVALEEQTVKYAAALASANKEIESAKARQDPWLKQMTEYHQKNLEKIKESEEAEKKVGEAVKKTTDAVKAQADAQKEVTTEKEKTAEVESRLNQGNSDGGGYDAGGSGAGGSFSGTTSAHGDTLSNAEWQALPKYMQDFLSKSVTEGSSSYDYFNSSSGNRFSGEQGFTQDWAGVVAQGASNQQSMITNNFNQSISRSDITGIIEETARTEART